jgi:hypothetical protein
MTSQQQLYVNLTVPTPKILRMRRTSGLYSMIPDLRLEGTVIDYK